VPLTSATSPGGAAPGAPVAGAPPPSKNTSSVPTGVALPAHPRDHTIVGGCVAPAQPWLDAKLMGTKSKFGVSGPLRVVVTMVEAAVSTAGWARIVSSMRSGRSRLWCMQQ
jgi:hypothetical protein